MERSRYDENLLWVVSNQTCGKRFQARGTAGGPHGCPALKGSTQTEREGPADGFFVPATLHIGMWYIDEGHTRDYGLEHTVLVATYRPTYLPLPGQH